MTFTTVCTLIGFLGTSYFLISNETKNKIFRVISLLYVIMTTFSFTIKLHDTINPYDRYYSFTTKYNVIKIQAAEELIISTDTIEIIDTSGKRHIINKSDVSSEITETMIRTQKTEKRINLLK